MKAWTVYKNVKQHAYLSDKNWNHLLETGILLQEKNTGRKIELYPSCIICGTECIAKSHLKKHVEKKHWWATYCLHNVVDRDQVCPIERCGKNFGGDYKAYSEHIKDPTLHDVEEIIEARQEPWKWYTPNEKDTITVVCWLI